VIGQSERRLPLRDRLIQDRLLLQGESIAPELAVTSLNLLTFPSDIARGSWRGSSLKARGGVTRAFRLGSSFL
jgi:hypothetical protein